VSQERVGLVHTISPLVALFDHLMAALLPEYRPLHLLDEPLLERVRQHGRLAPDDTARLGAHVAIAEQVGARAVLVTCSTLSPCVDEVRSRARIPVVKIDEAMISEAVATGTRIGVVATNPTTLGPTRRLLEAEAAACGKVVEVAPVVVERALEALLGGDGATHDRMVKEAVLRLAAQRDVEVVVLAQASTARALEVISEEERRAPILSSPHLALAQVRRLLAGA
jgi:Asp/Glu/hydantoin racemase